MRPMDELGREIADVQDARLESRAAHDLAHAREALLSTPVTPKKRTPRGLVPAIVLAAAAACFVVLWRPAPEVVPEPSLSFRVEGETGPESGQLGAWVATDDTPRTLSFSDGSSLELDLESRVRVDALDAHGAQVDLQDGALEVSAIHRADTSWSLRAGPFEVFVIGTRFRATWDPATQRFGLDLHEGEVRVEGPEVAGRAVRTGETLRVEVAEGRMEIVQPGMPREVEEEPVAPPPSAIAPRPVSQPARIDWRGLARRGRYAEAIAAADWDRELASGEAEDLLLLTLCARHGGFADRARAVTTALRTRFPGTPLAAQAAYVLGEMELRGGRTTAAVRLLGASLREAPRGPYAIVASGRLMEAYEHLGDREGARRSARAYLREHPDGPDVDLAERLAVADASARHVPLERDFGDHVQSPSLPRPDHGLIQGRDVRRLQAIE